MKFINKFLKECDLPLIDLSKCVCSLQAGRLKKRTSFIECPVITVKSLCKLYNVHIKECDYHHGIVDAVALTRAVCKMMEETSKYSSVKHKGSVGKGNKGIKMEIIVIIKR